MASTDPDIQKTLKALQKRQRRVTEEMRGDNGLGDIRELLRMAAAQTAENAKQIDKNAKQLEKYAAEHNREMKEIKTLFKQMIKRIAA